MRIFVTGANGLVGRALCSVLDQTEHQVVRAVRTSTTPWEVPVGDLQAAMKKAVGNILEQITLFDVYKGENIGKGFRSLAYTLQFSNSKQTLQDEEVSRPFDKIKNKLKEEFNAVIR